MDFKFEESFKDFHADRLLTFLVHAVSITITKFADFCGSTSPQTSFDYCFDVFLCPKIIIALANLLLYLLFFSSFLQF